VEGDKVSFYKMEGKGKDAKKTGDEITLPVIKAVKVLRMKKKGEEPEEMEDGLRNKRFTDISEKGVGALIVTDDDNKKIKEIRVFGGKKKQ
jgi:glucose/arabinose dehydrogenase